MRGAAWAFEQALGAVWYYADSNPVMSEMGRRTLGPHCRRGSAGVSRPPDRPEIVCLCGSIRFVDQLRAANRDLALAGVIVLSVPVY
jgi:hypothetical protein